MAPDFSWMRRIVNYAELSDEVLPGQTVIELVGEGRVLIEGHSGVLAYSDEEVCAKVTYGVARISGCNLKLSYMCEYKLVISGEILSIHLLRRNPE